MHETNNPDGGRSTAVSDAVGMAWWNRLPAPARQHWLQEAGSARPVDAYRAYVHNGFAPEHQQMRARARRASLERDDETLDEIARRAHEEHRLSHDERWRTVAEEVDLLQQWLAGQEPYQPRVAAIFLSAAD